MKLVVTNDAHPPSGIRLSIPTALPLNSATALILSKQLQRYGITLTSRQLAALFRVIRQCKRRRGDWTLLEVDSAGGEHVEIRL